VARAINNGFRQDLQDRLLGSSSHINLLRVQSDGISNWRALLDRLSKEPHIVAAAPAIYEQVLISRVFACFPSCSAINRHLIGYRG